MPDRPQTDPADQHSPEEIARRLDRALKRSVTMPPGGKKSPESGREKSRKVGAKLQTPIR